MDSFYNIKLEKLIKEKFQVAVSLCYLAPTFLISGALRNIVVNTTLKDLYFGVLDKTNIIVKLSYFLYISLSLVISPSALTGITSPKYLLSGLKIVLTKSLSLASTSLISLINCPLYLIVSALTP